MNLKRQTVTQQRLLEARARSLDSILRTDKGVSAKILSKGVM